MKEPKKEVFQKDVKLNADTNKLSAKKKFVKPELRRHETLPEVTNGFVGSFTT